jgi:hypothetical protein
MKIKFMLPVIAVVVGSLFTSCTKDTTPGTTVLAKDSTYDGDPNDAKVRTFEYNSSHQLIKVLYRYGTTPAYSQYDTIIYSTNITEVETFDVGNSTAMTTSNYYYTSNTLDSINKVGDNGSPYNLSTSFSYALGKLTTIRKIYNVGTSGGGGSPDSIKNIVYAGGNFSTGTLYQGGSSVGTAISVTAETTAANPYYGLIFGGTDDILDLFNANNITSVFPTGAPGSAFVTMSYTYSGGRVATIVNGGLTTTLTYTTL